MDFSGLIFLLKKHGLINYLIEWAGIFRIVGVRYRQGFTIDEWLELCSSKVDHQVINSVFMFLQEENLIKKQNGKYLILDDLKLQRIFEALSLIGETNIEPIQQKSEKLLWTLPPGQMVPSKISLSFIYLNSWVQISFKLRKIGRSFLLRISQ